MVVEAQNVAAFVFDVLKADATFSAAIGGRLYRDQIPQAAALPAGIVGPVVASPDSNTLSGRRVMSVVTLDVHVVAAGGSYGPINAAANRADELLQERSGVNGGVVVVKLRRDEPRLWIENESGQTFAHILQTWRSEAHST